MEVEPLVSVAVRPPEVTETGGAYRHAAIGAIPSFLCEYAASFSETMQGHIHAHPSRHFAVTNCLVSSAQSHFFLHPFRPPILHTPNSSTLPFLSANAPCH